MIIRTTVLVCLALTSTAYAQSWTVTGPNSGSGGGSASCTHGDASYTCNAARTYTGAHGRTVEGNRTRFADADGGTVTRNVVRPFGATITSTRTRTR